MSLPLSPSSLLPSFSPMKRSKIEVRLLVSVLITTYWFYLRRDLRQVLELSASANQNAVDNTRYKNYHRGLLHTLSQKPRETDGLEFIHITKTAGFSIESTFAKAGILIGACHWLNNKNLGKNCTKRDKKWNMEYNRKQIPIYFTRSHVAENWHTPHHWFKDNPYANKSTFCVVRNPYERLVSEFFWSCTKSAGVCENANKNITSETMNAFIQQRAKTYKHVGYHGHFFPQHLYVFDMKGNQVIDHILRFENLDEDFDALMQLYNLDIELPKKLNARNSTDLLTVRDLTIETIYVINKVYMMDFVRFSYPMVFGPDEF